MGINFNIFNKIRGDKKDAQARLEDLLEHIRNTKPELEHLHDLELKFREALDDVPGYKSFRTEKRISSEQLDENEEILFIYRKNHEKEKGSGWGILKFIRVLVCMLVITLGFAMIILPSSQGFEMYTLVYFNEQDGFTLMDLISLIIIFAGIYALVSTFSKKTSV